MRINGSWPTRKSENDNRLLKFIQFIAQITKSCPNYSSLLEQLTGHLTITPPLNYWKIFGKPTPFYCHPGQNLPTSPLPQSGKIQVKINKTLTANEFIIHIERHFDENGKETNYILNAKEIVSKLNDEFNNNKGRFSY